MCVIPSEFILMCEQIKVKGKNTVSKKLPDDDKIILAVKRILERHRKAFLELAKQ